MQKQRLIILLLILVLMNELVYSQPNTLYFMDGIHQSSQLNPAYQNPCNGYFALPVLSDINFDFSNTGFDFNDFFYNGAGEQRDSLYMDFNKLKSKLGKSNYLLTSIDIPIIGFGFWAGNSYFTFSFYNKTRMRFGYPKSLITLVDGNASYMGEDNPIEIDGFGPFALNYNELAFGLSKQITHRLIVGGKIKILMGNASVESRTSNIKLYTANNEFNPVLKLQTDFRLNASLPVDYKYDVEGNIDELLFDESSASSSAISTKNMGLGLDVGASYLLNDKIRLFASITDFGFIGWKNNTKNLTQGATYEFSGLSLDSVWSHSDYNEFQAISDSISNLFTISDSDTKYTTWLPTNIFLGATYEVNHLLYFGVLSKTFFYDRKLHQAFTLSANLKPARKINATISYSIMNRSYSNVGIGIRLAGFYFVTDYINAAFWPKNTKSVGFHFGFNMNFGCGKRQNYSMINNKKPQKDIDFM